MVLPQTLGAGVAGGGIHRRPVPAAQWQVRVFDYDSEVFAAEEMRLLLGVLGRIEREGVPLPALALIDRQGRLRRVGPLPESAGEVLAVLAEVMAE